MHVLLALFIITRLQLMSKSLKTTTSGNKTQIIDKILNKITSDIQMETEIQQISAQFLKSKQIKNENEDYDESTLTSLGFLSLPGDFEYLLCEADSVHHSTSLLNVGGEELYIPNSLFAFLKFHGYLFHMTGIKAISTAFSFFRTKYSIFGPRSISIPAFTSSFLSK